jgi:DnaD/phage-associated family protein
MVAFAGFPSGRNPLVPVPEVFFTTVLPEIEDPNEMKVTTYLFATLFQKRGQPRCVSDRELQADVVLRRALRRRGDPRPAEEKLRLGLDLAVRRGTLLRVRVRVDGEIISWYFFNTERNRRVVERLLQGDLSPTKLLEVEGTATEGLATAIEVERPTIFTLYEQNIGLLVPLVAEQLADAAERYPIDWIDEAFREAIEQNKRSWSYIRAILRRWETEGKGGKRHETGTGRRAATAL